MAIRSMSIARSIYCPLESRCGDGSMPVCMPCRILSTSRANASLTCVSPGWSLSFAMSGIASSSRIIIPMLRNGFGDSKPQGAVSTMSEHFISASGKADETAATARSIRASRWPLFEPIFRCISIVVIVQANEFRLIVDGSLS